MGIWPHQLTPLRRRISEFLLVLGMLGLLTTLGTAQINPEYQVKGAFITKFPLFVEWPTTAFTGVDDPLIVGILGTDPFGAAFETALKDLSVNGRKFELKRAQKISELSGCHILFISAAEPSPLPKILASLRGQFALTVGESDDFTRVGGMIRFYKDDGKLRFEVNASATERAGLKISSKLLQHARVVHDELSH